MEQLVPWEELEGRIAPAGCRLGNAKDGASDTSLRDVTPEPVGQGREAVFDPESEELLVQVPPLPEGKLYPKEQALVDLVAAERLAGPPRARLRDAHGHAGHHRAHGGLPRPSGFKVAVMKADAVPPERREAWVAKRVEEGVDVLVCHPRLVQTCELTETGVEPPLSTETRGLLFSIAHNALTNAYRHAEASSVAIHLSCGKKEVRLSVLDDGVGLPADYGQRGRGFENMDGNAQRLGGRLVVEPRGAMGGATVTCVIPQERG